MTKSYSICATVLTLFVPAPALAPTLGRSRLSPHPGDPRFSGQHHSSTSPNRTKRTSVTELPQIPGRYSADHALAAQIPLPALRHWRSRYAHPLPSTRRRSSPVLPLKPRASLQAMHADLDELLRHATWPRHWSTGQYATPGRQSRAIHRHLPHHWAARAFAVQGGGFERGRHAGDARQVYRPRPAAAITQTPARGQCTASTRLGQQRAIVTGSMTVSLPSWVSQRATGSGRGGRLRTPPPSRIAAASASVAKTWAIAISLRSLSVILAVVPARDRASIVSVTNSS